MAKNATRARTSSVLAVAGPRPAQVLATELGHAERDACCLDDDAVRRLRGQLEPLATVTAVAQTLRLLGDPTRLRLARALSHGEFCVGDLAALIGASRSVVSHSLSALRRMRLVRHRRDGKLSFYALDDAHVARVLDDLFGHAAE